MAESIFKNKATFTGLYGVDECPIEFSTNEVSTTIITGLTATKTADKKCWADGFLTYTITIKNNTGQVITGGVMTDSLNPSIVALDSTYGVYIDGTSYSQYTYGAGTLTVNLPTIEVDDEVIITFRATKV